MISELETKEWLRKDGAELSLTPIGTEVARDLLDALRFITVGWLQVSCVVAFGMIAKELGWRWAIMLTMMALSTGFVLSGLVLRIILLCEGVKVKVYLDCFPCFMRQALDAARMATDDLAVQREVLDRVAELLPAVPLDSTPIDMGQLVHRLVREVTGVADPYEEVKKESNDLGLKLYPTLKSQVEGSEDPLLTALKIAGAGNIIDFGPKLTMDPNRSLDQIVNDSFIQALQEPLDSVQYSAFKEKLAEIKEILYLGDNTGETVCDKILIEELMRQGKEVTFVTRGEPTINDATLADARYVGLDKVSTVITNGSDAPGTRLEDCSPEFVAAFQSAKLIISKGQGNFEGLSNVPGPIFFLFKVKCPVIARETEAEIGTVVLREQTVEKVTPRNELS